MNHGAAPPIDPWKGLEYYSEKDRDVFFGREQESEDLLRLVQRDILTILFARSGLGKSSLLRAGLSPRLREQNFLPVLVRCDYSPSAQPPVRQVIAAVLSAASAAEIEVDATDGIVTPTAADEWPATLWEFLHTRRFWSPHNDPVTPVLILDQFEEIFTLGQQSPHVSEFLVQLADLAENRMPKSVQSRLETTGERPTFDTRSQNYKIILALREDYVPRLDPLRPTMPAVMRNRYELTLLSHGRALDVVLKAGGQWVSSAVAQDIVAAVAGNDSSHAPEALGPLQAPEVEPAYLSVMCDELFRHMVAQDKSEIDSGLVREERGKILDGLYERSFSGLNPATRIFVEDRLLTRSGFRSSVPAQEAEEQGIPRADLESLVTKHRLLRREVRLGTTHIELSHDRLVPIVRKSRDARLARDEAEKNLAAERHRAAEFAAKLKRERSRLRLALATVGVLVGVIAFVLYGWVFPYDSYCRAFSKRWGLVDPVGELPASAVAHRQSTLRLTQKGWFGPVMTVSVINASNEFAANSPITTYLAGSGQSGAARANIARIEFEQNRLGRVVSEIAFDRFGRMVWGFVYVPDEKSRPSSEPTDLRARIARLFPYFGGDSGGNRPRLVKGMFLGADGYPQPQGHSRAEFVEIRYDQHGFESELHYQDRDGRPMPGPDAAFGQRKDYDAQGRLSRLTSLNEIGRPMNDEVGNAGLEIGYDDDGNQTEQRAFDASGEPTLIKSGFYRQRSGYDEWGRITENRFFDLSGEPVEEGEQIGAHLARWTYDDRGNPVSVKLFDRSDNPLIAGKRFFDFAAHEQRATFDAGNRVENVAYFDGSGKPLNGPDGWQQVRYTYDAKGFVSTVAYFNQADQPVDTSNGFHKVLLTNDEYGQPTEERFFGADGKPREAGHHLQRNEYDRAGNLTGQAYFDASVRPVLSDSLAHRVSKRYDRFGNPLIIEYFDANKEPINNSQGFHREVSSYDTYGSKRRTRWYDLKGLPVKGSDGVHDIRNRYDERGLLIATLHFSAANLATTDRQGVHETIYAYNDKRQESIRQFFGLERKPAEDGFGNHLIVHEFDKRGNPIRLTQLRADGRPNLDAELGIATVTRVYNKAGKWIEQAFRDRTDNLVVGPWGYAKARDDTEADGSRAMTFYGPDEKPTFNPLQGFVARRTVSRTPNDETISYHDARGELAIGPEGYAEARYHWDNHNNLISVAYFGPADAPLAGPDGFHRAERPPLDDGPFRHYAADGTTMPSLGPETIAPVIAVSAITDTRQAAARAGLQAGDILWRYAQWSYPQALENELAKGTEFFAIPAEIRKTFLAQRNLSSPRAVALTVIRHGRAIRLTVPPLPAGNLGVGLADRAVPSATFAEWKKEAAGPATK